MKAILLGLLSCYQMLLRPFVGPSCRFTPSCSEYCREAIAKYGAWKGFILGVKRLVRCHPFSKCPPFDPVP